jgi:dihydrofolate reductase
MRSLSYFVAMTVDGFIADEAGGFDFFPMEGDHIAAQASDLPETLPAHVRAALGLGDRAARFDTVLMGRRTYEPALAAGIEDPYAPLQTFVFSRTLEARTAGRLRICRDDPREIVRQLKGAPGRDLWLCGGGELAGQLADQIDELVVKVNPLWIGRGTPLRRGEFRVDRLVLESTRTFDSGVVWLTYRARTPLRTTP